MQHHRGGRGGGWLCQTETTADWCGLDLLASRVLRPLIELLWPVCQQSRRRTKTGSTAAHGDAHTVEVRQIHKITHP